jgi:hypothetical protein
MPSESAPLAQPAGAPPTAPRSDALLDMCRRCHRDFARGDRRALCALHPGAHAGETQQRWSEPGDHHGGGRQHWFWTCCGQADYSSPGCAARRHVAFDEDPGVLEDDYAKQSKLG